MRVRSGLIQLKLRPVREIVNTVMNLHDQLLKKTSAPKELGKQKEHIMHSYHLQ